MRILGIFLSVLVLLVAGALLAPQFIDWNNYKPQIISQVEEASGFQMQIEGDLDLSVFPTPHMVVNKVRLQKPSDERPLLTLEQAEIYLDVMPLLKGEVSLQSITLYQPVVALRILKDGSQNWMTDKLSAQKAVDENTSEGGAKSQTKVTIDSLNMRDGAISYEDMTTGTLQRLDNLSGAFSMQSLNGPFDIAASLDVMGLPLNISVKTDKLNPETSSVALNAKAGLKGAEASFSGVVGYGAIPDMQGETGITIANLKDFLSAVTGQKQADTLDFSFKSNGMLTSDGKAARYQNVGALIGDVKLTGGVEVINIQEKSKTRPVIVSLNLEGEGQTKLKGDIVLKENAISVNNMNMAYGTSDLKGGATWTFPEKADGRPNLSANIISTNLDVDALKKALGIKDAAGQSHAGTTDIKKAAKDISIPFNADVNISIDQLKMDQTAYHGLSAKGSISGQSVVLREVGIKDLAGLSAAVKGKIANVNALAGLDLNISAASKDVEKTLEAFEQLALLKTMPPSIGAVDIQTKVSGSIDSFDFDGSLKALSADAAAAGHVKDVLTAPAFTDMSFSVKHSNLATLLHALFPQSEKNPALEKPINLSSQIDLKDQVYTLNNLKGAFGPISVEGTMSADMKASVPYISGNLSTGKLPLETLIGEAKTSTGSAQTGSSASGGRWSTDPIDTAWLKSANADISLQASEITYGGWDFIKPSFALVMNGGTLKIKDWKSGLFGGQSALNLEMTGGDVLAMQADLSLKNVGLQPLVVALAGAPIVQSNGTTDFQASLSARGGSASALISALNGEGTVKGDDITIRGINVAELSRALSNVDSLGSQAQALFKTGIKGGSSSFDTLDGAFKVQSGAVNFSKLDLAGKDADIATTGIVSLPAWTIDMKSSVQLHVAEGEEVPPPLEISYRGSLSNPGSSFAQNAVEGYLNRKISAKVNKLIEKKLGDKLDGQLGGVIGGILGVQPQIQQNTHTPAVDEPATTSTPDAANDNSEPVPQHKKVEPEDVVKDVLKGFLQ